MAEIKPTRERLSALEARAMLLKEQIAFCRDMDKLERSGALNVVRKNLAVRVKAIEGKLDGFLDIDHENQFKFVKDIISLLQNRRDIKLQARMYEPQGKRLETYQSQLEKLDSEIVEYRKRLRRAYG